jgi:hypothetical protein
MGDSGMEIDLFAGIPVNDYDAALAWYEPFPGSPPTMFPDDTEAAWELAEHRYLYIDVRPEHAGHAKLTLFVDDFDALIAQVAERGIEATRREVYDNGVRKTTYHDLDGNENWVRRRSTLSGT